MRQSVFRRRRLEIPHRGCRAAGAQLVDRKTRLLRMDQPKALQAAGMIN